MFSLPRSAVNKSPFNYIAQCTFRAAEVLLKSKIKSPGPHLYLRAHDDHQGQCWLFSVSGMSHDHQLSVVTFPRHQSQLVTILQSHLTQMLSKSLGEAAGRCLHFFTNFDKSSGTGAWDCGTGARFSPTLA